MFRTLLGMTLLGIVTQAVRLIVRKGLAAIDRWTEPPIIHQLIDD